MAKRPTLSIPRKAKHKGLNNPISGLKPARSSLDYDQNLFTAPVKPKVRELQRKSSSFCINTACQYLFRCGGLCYVLVRMD